MKKTIKALKFSLVFSLVLVSFLACDKDFSVVESDVLGEQNSNFKTDSTSFHIAAYNKKLDSIQINGLSSNLLGVYNDPAYGQTVASIIAQMVPSTYSPVFGANTVIDSVILSIPYFNKVTGSDDEGNPTYILDSLYGKKSDKKIKPFKLSIYQNNYFLRDFDPSLNLNEKQIYYSKVDGTVLNGNSNINFETHKGATIYVNSLLMPSSKPTKTSITKDSVKVTTQSAPSLRASLDPAFWKTTIIDKGGDAVLSKLSDFTNYFRGLYLKAEAVDGDGNMILLNLSSANITIYYSKDSTVEGEKVQADYVLKFSGNILNTFTNNYSSVPLQNGNKTTGDKKLYLKGAEGSMAIVDLFSGNTALKDFIDNYRIPLANGGYKKDPLTGNFILKRLINDVQLIVYEEDELPTGGNADLHKYDRLYVYDIKNNKPLNDYYLDPTKGNTANPFNSSFFHLGQRQKDATTGVSKYKIHLTEHLNNILLKDSTNTKIGLTLSSNVNLIGNAKILNSEDEVTSIPATSIITPRGTILYGTETTVPENRKMKLKIFYTETK